MSFGPIVQRRTPTLFAGRLRHKIDIVKPTEAQDSTGGTDVSSNTIFATVRASVEAVSGTETFAAQELLSRVSHQVVIRYLAGVNSAQQVHFQGRQFQIEAVLNPDGRSKLLILLCVEINDSAQQNP
jgi:SPP1 family predicted phage head-tail adaptor